MTTTDIINRASEMALVGDIDGLEDLKIEIADLLISTEERASYICMISTMIVLAEGSK